MQRHFYIIIAVSLSEIHNSTRPGRSLNLDSSVNLYLAMKAAVIGVIFSTILCLVPVTVQKCHHSNDSFLPEKRLEAFKATLLAKLGLHSLPENPKSDRQVEDLQEMAKDAYERAVDFFTPHSSSCATNNNDFYARELYVINGSLSKYITYLYIILNKCLLI